MFIVLGLLCVGIAAGYLLRHAPICGGLERSISYTIFVMLFVFGISIGANRALLRDLGEFGAQAALLAVCGVAGSLLASYIAYRLFIRKGLRDVYRRVLARARAAVAFFPAIRADRTSRLEPRRERGIGRYVPAHPPIRLVAALIHHRRHLGVLRGCQPVAKLVECLRLHGGGERIRVLFPLVRAHHAIERGVRGRGDRFALRRDRPVSEYHPGDAGAVRRSALRGVVRKVRAGFRGGHQLHGCLLARHQPLFREECRADRDHPRNRAGGQRSVAYLVLLWITGWVYHLFSYLCYFIVKVN